jgi:hypothetical protein
VTPVPARAAVALLEVLLAGSPRLVAPRAPVPIVGIDRREPETPPPRGGAGSTSEAASTHRTIEQHREA